MKPLKYKEIMPRVAIENLKLIEVDDLISLIGKDLEFIRRALADSPYREHISAISPDEINSVSLEAVLLQNYAETYKKLVKFSSGSIRSLLLAVLKKFEVSNVKTMLRATKAKIDVDEAMKHIVPVGVLDRNRCRAILAGSKSIDDVINSLADLEYGLVMNGVLNERERIEELTQLEVALDKAVYQGILESAEKLKGVDKKIAKDILGIELDAINVRIILKCKALGVSQELIKDYLMPAALFDEETLEEATKATSTKSMISRLLIVAETGNLVYKNIFTQMLKECDAPLSRLEAILDKASLKMSLYMLKEHTRYYNIGFVLAFLNLKWLEVKNVRCIIKGAERNSPPSQVRKLLALPGEW
jgi:V/A-type H+-transporting ATPase subunit C